MTQIDPEILETATGPTTLDDIHGALDSLWAMHPEVPPAVRIQVGIAVAEVGANIIEHAGGGEPVRMRMESRVRSNVVEITFDDDGRPVDIDLASVCLPDEMAERGRGLSLANSVLGRLSYERTGVTNRWTLVSERFG